VNAASTTHLTAVPKSILEKVGDYERDAIKEIARGLDEARALGIECGPVIDVRIDAGVAGMTLTVERIVGSKPKGGKAGA
jgi:hypothetical protein